MSRHTAVKFASSIMAAAALAALGLASPRATTVARHGAEGRAWGGPAGGAEVGRARAAAPGTQLWASRFGGAGNTDDNARAMAVSPSAGRVFVTGGSGSGASATPAYSAVTGAQLWVARASSWLGAIAVNPQGTRVFVTGARWGGAAIPGLARMFVTDWSTVAHSAGSEHDYATIAYQR